MFKIIILLVVIYLVFYVWKNNLRVDFKSFFKKGFKKLDSKFGIICYTAKQGMGKTYCAIKFCIEQLMKTKNLICLTNVKSFYTRSQKQVYKDRVLYFSSIFEIIDYVLNNPHNRYLIFFDEIFTVLERGGSICRTVRSFLSQLRKREILFVTTAQEWSEINISFRRYVRFHVVPSMQPLPFTHDAIIIKHVNDGDYIHWDNDLQDFVAPLIETQISKGNRDIINMYDTFETINMTASANK